MYVPRCRDACFSVSTLHKVAPTSHIATYHIHTPLLSFKYFGLSPTDAVLEDLYLRGNFDEVTKPIARKMQTFSKDIPTPQSTSKKKTYWPLKIFLWVFHHRKVEHVENALHHGEKYFVASAERFVNIASANQNCCGDNFNCYNNNMKSPQQLQL